MAFLLIDRITHLDPGRGARGDFTVPLNTPGCPPFLLAEAVGQLAGWAAMAQVDFRSRPVAALAGEVLVSGEGRPGDTIDLAVHLDGIERGGVLYGGSAALGGKRLLVMNRCVGPLLPMEDFDDPEAMRAHLRCLLQDGARCGSLVPVEAPLVEILSEVPGERLRAALQVPLEAPFFAEHFPRRPVYPATVLLDRKIHLAQRLLHRPGSVWRVRRAAHVKISAFILPGERVEIEAVRVNASEDEAAVQLTGSRAGARVSRARMEFVRYPV